MASSISRLISSVGAATRRVLRGQDGPAATLQTMLSRLLILGINVVTGIITARTLGPTGRGEQAAMILWSGFLASTMTLGLPSSLVYNLKRYPEEKSQLLCAALFLSSGLGLAASVIGIVFMPQWLAQYSAEDSDLLCSVVHAEYATGSTFAGLPSCARSHRRFYNCQSGTLPNNVVYTSCFDWICSNKDANTFYVFVSVYVQLSTNIYLDANSLMAALPPTLFWFSHFL